MSWRRCLLRNCPTVFRRGCTILNSYEQCAKLLHALHYSDNTWYGQSWILAKLMGVVLIYISPMIHDVEPPFLF